MLKGTLEGCVLEIISGEETYGYAITRRLNELGFTDVVEGTVYTILLRLEKNGLVQVTKKPSGMGPSRKFYALNDCQESLGGKPGTAGTEDRPAAGARQAAGAGRSSQRPPPARSRSSRKNRRTSSTSNCGCSIAGKCPPRSWFVHRTMLLVRSAM